ncbi:MAG: four-carbon acid sugar kinase family protein [Candidatus Methylomirabilales bacterium]
MPVRLGVIADDLTGANDTGVQFARQGARTIVPLDWHDLTSLGRHADVLVLSTNSRGLPPGAAAQRAKLAAQALRKARVAAIYKKIDSTFRGNVGAELDAILDIYPARLTILTPSFPPAGRAVINGILTVDGIPVHRTAIGRDPVAPVRQSHLPTLLQAQSRRSIHHLPLEILRARWPRAARAIRSWQPTDGGLVVADAATAADLRRLARLIAQEGLLGVAAGSAGLAAALSVALPWRRRRLRRLSSVEHPILLVVGSPNPTSLAQVADFQRRRSGEVIHGDIREVLAGPERFRRELERILGKASAEVAAGRDTVITLAQVSDGRPALRRRGSSARGKRLTPLSPCASATLSEFLGRSARELTRRVRLGALILCGGDIAVATCRALRADGIILGGEVQPGVPWGRLVGGEHPNLPVVTKAGGFGAPDVFRAAVRFLRQPRSR